MNRFDLIIECMDEILNDELPSPEKMMTAYRYAHELKELYPQGAKVRPAEFITAASIGVGADFVGTPMMWAEWPTRSDEVKHDWPTQSSRNGVECNAI